MGANLSRPRRGLSFTPAFPAVETAGYYEPSGSAGLKLSRFDQLIARKARVPGNPVLGILENTIQKRALSGQHSAFSIQPLMDRKENRGQERRRALQNCKGYCRR